MKRLRLRRSTWLWLGPTCILAAVLILGSIPQGALRITPPPSDAEVGRWVHIEGAANTRDLGGYATSNGQRVKRKMVYRSAKLNRLTAAGVATFRELHLEVVIDFCNRLTPWPLFGGDVWGVQLVSSVRGCPMSFSGDGPPEEFYIRGVRENADAFREAFTLLADESNYPLLYHCAAGTDRTGVMSALLLLVLNVDRETVIADFRLSERVNHPGSLPAMEALLDQVASAGGIEKYLEALDVKRETLQCIRSILLETP